MSKIIVFPKVFHCFSWVAKQRPPPTARASHVSWFIQRSSHFISSSLSIDLLTVTDLYPFSLVDPIVSGHMG